MSKHALISRFLDCSLYVFELIFYKKNIIKLNFPKTPLDKTFNLFDCFSIYKDNNRQTTIFYLGIKIFLVYNIRFKSYCTYCHHTITIK